MTPPPQPATKVNLSLLCLFHFKLRRYSASACLQLVYKPSSRIYHVEIRFLSSGFMSSISCPAQYSCRKMFSFTPSFFSCVFKKCNQMIYFRRWRWAHETGSLETGSWLQAEKGIYNWIFSSNSCRVFWMHLILNWFKNSKGKSTLPFILPWIRKRGAFNVTSSYVLFLQFG